MLRIIFVFLLGIQSCFCEEFPYVIKGNTFGTTYKIIISSSRVIETKSLKDKIEKKFREFDAVISNWNQASVISKANAKNGNYVINSALFEEIFNKSKAAHTFTEGFFNPTVNSKKMDDSNFAFESVKFDSNILFKTSQKLNFSGISKGLAVDHIAEMLLKMKHPNFLVEVGGELRSSGLNAGKKWGIQIINPTTGRMVDNILVENVSVATSGVSFKKNHIIDPVHNKVIDSEVLSVTVFSDKCYRADFIATALIAMNDESIEFIKKNKLKVIVLTSNEGKLKIKKYNF